MIGRGGGWGFPFGDSPDLPGGNLPGVALSIIPPSGLERIAVVILETDQRPILPANAGD
jgi:hypothetical protein